MAILKNTKDLCKMLSLSAAAIEYRAKILGIETIRRKYLFTSKQVSQIVNFNKINVKIDVPKERIPKVYPLKTTQTFYIYESKINKQ